MGQGQRFKDEVLPHLDDALAVARWLTGNATDAQDVVQEACLRAYLAVGSMRETNPRGWLLAIVRNTALTWLAKNRPKALVHATDDELYEEAARALGHQGATSPEAALIARGEAALLHQAVAALPVVFREVIVMRELEELSYREISQALSIPIGTVMSRLARGRKLLMAALIRPPTHEASSP